MFAFEIKKYKILLAHVTHKLHSKYEIIVGAVVFNRKSKQ